MKTRRAGFLALIVLGAVLSTASTAEPFSRAAWIVRNMERFPFSSGVIPGGGPLPVPLAPARSPAPVPVDRRLTAPRLVSGDLLASDGVSQASTQAEPYLAADPENRNHLLAGWQESRFSDGGSRGLGYAVSTNRGTRWQSDVMPFLTLANRGPWQRASDPWVAISADDRAYFASLLFNQTDSDNAIGVSVSTDGGATWGAPVEINRNRRDFNDKQAIVVDNAPPSRYFGRAYVAWDSNVTIDGVNVVAQHLLVARSHNGGESWLGPRTVRAEGVNIGVIPRVGPDGTVYLIWAGAAALSDPGFSIYFSRSTNGGVHWSAPRVVENLLSNGITGFRIGESLPSFDVDPTSGDLYVAWQDARFSGVDQATLMTSRDGGATWSAPVRVSDGPADAATFTVAVAADGRGGVGVSYFSVENDPQRRFLLDRYLRVSRDFGASFERSMRVTPASFDIRFAAQALGFFLGDYMGLAATDRSFHLLWVDTSRFAPELGRPEPEVFTARTR